MSQQIVDFGLGVSIDEAAERIAGTGIPGSGTNDSVAQTVGVGAMYQKLDDGSLYMKITGGATTADWIQIPDLSDVQDLIQVLEFQNSALDFIADNTLAPLTENDGDRYILSDAGGVPHANYDGASAGDIVEYDAATDTWIATTPTIGMFISADDQSDLLYYFGGTSWTTKNFEATTATTGLTKIGFDIQLEDATSNAISVSGGVIDVIADGIDDTMIDFGFGANQVSAIDLPYDNATSGMTATEVQGAIDELDGRVDALELISPAQIDDLANTGGVLTTVDSVLVDEVAALTWHILLEDTVTGDREYVHVSATHDGSADGVTDATALKFNVYNKLRLANVGGDDYQVALTGTGAGQALELQVNATNGFDVRSIKTEVIYF